MRVLPYGEQAVLIELPDTASVLGARQQLLQWLASQPRYAGATVVPAARTVLLDFNAPPPPAGELAEVLRSLPGSVAGSGSRLVELAVSYDGADLAAVAAETGLTPAAVVRLHSGPDYVVQFCGFSPGFGYLTGLDERLRLPRLASPRVEVPAGSVAIADEFTGVYPRASPGGWRLLGRTDARLFDLDRDPPAVLTPGTRVRFLPR
jgi:KipI family sensor histidine kinase inhibitor